MNICSSCRKCIVFFKKTVEMNGIILSYHIDCTPAPYIKEDKN